MDPFTLLSGASSLATLATDGAAIFGGHEHYAPSHLTYNQDAALLASNETEIDQLTGQAPFQRPSDHGGSQDVTALKGLVAKWLGDPSYTQQNWDDLREKGIVDLAIQKQDAELATLQAGGGGSFAPVLLLVAVGGVALFLLVRK